MTSDVLGQSRYVPPDRRPRLRADNGIDRRYGWGERPGIVIEGVPATVPVPVQAVPAAVSVPARQVADGPCNCLPKQHLPDGSVLFQDICTKESAIAAPQAAGTR